MVVAIEDRRQTAAWSTTSSGVKSKKARPCSPSIEREIRDFLARRLSRENPKWGTVYDGHWSGILTEYNNPDGAF